MIDIDGFVSLCNFQKNLTFYQFFRFFCCEISCKQYTHFYAMIAIAPQSEMPNYNLAMVSWNAFNLYQNKTKPNKKKNGLDSNRNSQFIMIQKELIKKKLNNIPKIAIVFGISRVFIKNIQWYTTVWLPVIKIINYVFFHTQII